MNIFKSFQSTSTNILDDENLHIILFHLYNLLFHELLTNKTIHDFFAYSGEIINLIRSLALFILKTLLLYWFFRVNILLTSDFPHLVTAKRAIYFKKNIQPHSLSSASMHSWQKTWSFKGTYYQLETNCTHHFLF